MHPFNQTKKYAFMRIAKKLGIQIHERCSKKHPSSSVATICIPDPNKFYRALDPTKPLQSFSNAYTCGLWESPCVSLITEIGSRWLMRRNQIRLPHTVTKSSKINARRNIIFHYDHNPKFYANFLDKNMHYSCAIFPKNASNYSKDTSDTELEEAQNAKADSLLNMLQGSSALHILDLGCGWGAMSIYLAQKGHHVDALTISPTQAEYVRSKLRNCPKLSQNLKVQESDFSTITNTYDAIVSVEMIESIGKDRISELFEVISNSLNSEGRLILQVIVQSAQRPNRKKQTWIQENVFPGGYIPTLQEMIDIPLNYGLTPIKALPIGRHYVRTLQYWKDNFISKDQHYYDKLPEKEKRKWQYYFSYCEGGFRSGYLNVWQLCYTKEVS